jgi:RecA/RadA recombinase
MLCVRAVQKHDVAMTAGSEVCGEAGSGKTQLLMSTQHGGLGRKAVYICTEGEPPTTRLFQIAQEHVAAYPDAFERGHPLDHIMIEKVCSDGASWKSRQRKCTPNVTCA